MKRFKQLHYLSWDHRTSLMEAFNILKYIDVFSDSEVFRKRDFVLKLYQKDLLLHFRTEEECLLSRISLQKERQPSLIIKTIEDHLLIHSLIVLLKKETGDIQKIKTILKGFAKSLNDHIRFEERELYEHAQSILEENDFNEIEAEIFERYGDKYKSSSCELPEID